MPKPTVVASPHYVIGPQGNKIAVRGRPVQMLPPLGPPQQPLPTNDVVYKPPVVARPMPPIRVLPTPGRVLPLPTPPIYYPQPRPYPGRRRPPQRHRGRVRLQRRFKREKHYFPVSPRPPIQIAPTPIVTPPQAPVVPVVGGKICPSWGWMVKTNEDGSETVVKCQPGLPSAPGLHGLDGITDTLQGALGPNWILYIGAGIAAWYFLKRR